MEKQLTISIGLHVNQQVIDLQIPIAVSSNRLKELLQESLGRLGIPLPEVFELEIINKAIRLNGDIPLVNYPLGDGDQLIVKEFLEK